MVCLNQKSIDIYLFFNEDRLILGQVAEWIERTLQMLEVRTPLRWKGGDNQKMEGSLNWLEFSLNVNQHDTRAGSETI